jgi:hypothetical protein
MTRLLLTAAPALALAGSANASCLQSDEGELSNHNCYTNEFGNDLHSPAWSYDGPPPGTSAQCADGTYSFSQHRRGACSGHGGVRG